MPVSKSKYKISKHKNQCTLYELQAHAIKLQLSTGCHGNGSSQYPEP